MSKESKILINSLCLCAILVIPVVLLTNLISYLPLRYALSAIGGGLMGIVSQKIIRWVYND